MTNLAVIAGQLVDARNVGTHKSVKLTIHVPQEEAMKVFGAFGWPTMTDPVPVAVARIDLKAEPRARKGSLAQQAGMACDTPAFQVFLKETHPHIGALTPAEKVREICGVDSRAEFDRDPAKGQLWQQLHGKYLGWCQQ